MKKVLYALITIIGFGNATMAQVPSYVPTNGLVGYWPFNGNANDASGNGNNGTVTGATLVNDRFGQANTAYNFDGVSNYIDVPSSSLISNYPNGQTISFWFKITTFPNDGKEHYIISKTSSNGQANSYFQIFLSNYTSVNTFNYRYGISANQSSQGSNIPFAQIQLNTWNNLCFTTDLTTTKTYLNGVLFMTYNQYSSIGSNSSNLSFGKPWSSNATYGYFNGQMDDIGIWNRTLTQQEITNLYRGCNDSIITTEPTNTSVGVGLNAQFSTASATGSSYQWQADAAGLGWQNVSNNNQYSGSNTNNLNVNNVSVSNQNQRFRVIAIKSGCTDTSDVALLNVTDTCLTKVTDTLIIQITLGIPTPNISNTLLIYPNPAKDRITIDNGNYTVMSGYSIKIQNSLGQQVFNSAITQAQFNIDLSTWTGKGIYYVRLLDASGNVVTTRKILLQ
jgi:hypothetical protein